VKAGDPAAWTSRVQHPIRESSHRIINPFDDAKLATLGAAIGLRGGDAILDLACGKGELLCTWARDHGTSGVGVDKSVVFSAAARARAEELGVADRVSIIHGDASSYVADTRVDIGSCMGATWIGDGVAGTIRLLERSLRPGGLVLIGEPYWRREPPDDEAVDRSGAPSRDRFRSLAGLVEHFHDLGYDVVEMVLADQDSWDRYVAAQWMNTRRWLDANPDDELAEEMRDDLTRSQLDYTTYTREYLGWGMFALLSR
jgi:SAM-dependent methyltransferase